MDSISAAELSRSRRVKQFQEYQNYLDELDAMDRKEDSIVISEMQIGEMQGKKIKKLEPKEQELPFVKIVNSIFTGNELMSIH